MTEYKKGSRHQPVLADHPENRWQNMLAAGDPRALERQCTAMSKQTGKRCRNAARRGQKVCGFHGVKRSDRKSANTVERQAASTMVNAHDRLLRQMNAEGALHPDAKMVYRESFAGRVAPHCYSAFMLDLDAKLKGTISGAVWRRVLKKYLV